MRKTPVCHILETICKEERLSLQTDDVGDRFGYDLDVILEDPRLRCDDNDQIWPRTWSAEEVPNFLYSVMSKRMWIRLGETGLVDDKIQTYFTTLEAAMDYAKSSRVGKPVYYQWTPDVERSVIWYVDEQKTVWKAHKTYQDMCEEVVLTSEHESRGGHLATL